MPGTFHVEWLTGGVLLLRRDGLFTPDEARSYVAAGTKAIEKAPARWGAVVDVRSAVAQTDEVQPLIQDLVRHVTAKNALLVAVVSDSAITSLQERRITIGPGLHDASRVAFYDDFHQAVADVRAAAH